jgi:hypothetical protein
MASNLTCLGLGVENTDELRRLVSDVLPRSISLGVVGNIDIRRWEDPSGVRLVFGVNENDMPDLLPSFAGNATAKLAGVSALSPDVTAADVMEDGEVVTRIALELEERRFLDPTAPAPSGRASVVALGRAVTLYQDEESFADSPDSLVASDDGKSREPPAHYVERGWKWPPRMAAESFISSGLFGSPSAEARLYGTVLSAEHRTVVQTGNAIDVLVTRTAGFEATVCVPGGSLGFQPKPGNILGGLVYLVGSMPSIGPLNAVPVPSRKSPRLFR